MDVKVDISKHLLVAAINTSHEGIVIIDAQQGGFPPQQGGFPPDLCQPRF